jgi:signal transduction histidine kinase
MAVLKLLASQAAIALENAGLYTDLHQENRERQRAEEALRQSEVYLSEAQRLSHTGSFGWRISTGELLWSEETFHIFRYDQTTTPTVDLVLQRVHPEDAAFVKQTIEHASQEGKDFDVEHRLLMPDGSVTHVHVVAHALGDASGRVEFVGAVMDVTERKRAEEALRHTQAALAHVTRVTTVGELTASIAHEVNQPLAAVVTNGNACLRWLARAEPDLEEARAAVERIIRDGHRASEVLTLVHSEVLMQRVSLRAELSAALPPVRGDRIQLQQVIMNLVINGIEAMQAVTDRARELQIRSQRHDADHVLVAVQDSGIGLDPQHMARLFDAFFTTKAGGMGMGLAISRSIIEAHGGRLWASANAGLGAAFQCTLPLHSERQS